MALTKERNQQKLNHVALADDDTLDVADERLDLRKGRGSRHRGLRTAVSQIGLVTILSQTSCLPGDESGGDQGRQSAGDDGDGRAEAPGDSTGLHLAKLWPSHEEDHVDRRHAASQRIRS